MIFFCIFTVSLHILQRWQHWRAAELFRFWHEPRSSTQCSIKRNIEEPIGNSLKQPVAPHRNVKETRGGAKRDLAGNTYTHRVEKLTWHSEAPCLKVNLPVSIIPPSLSTLFYSILPHSLKNKPYFDWLCALAVWLAGCVAKTVANVDNSQPLSSLPPRQAAPTWVHNLPTYYLTYKLELIIWANVVLPYY